MCWRKWILDFLINFFFNDPELTSTRALVLHIGIFSSVRFASSDKVDDWLTANEWWERDESRVRICACNMLGWVGSWVSGWVSEWVSQWMSEWKWEGGWVKVGRWVSEWVSGCMSEWVDEWVNEWVSGWVSEWVYEWVDRWVNEWVSAVFQLDRYNVLCQSLVSDIKWSVEELVISSFL